MPEHLQNAWIFSSCILGLYIYKIYHMRTEFWQLFEFLVHPTPYCLWLSVTDMRRSDEWWWWYGCCWQKWWRKSLSFCFSKQFAWSEVLLFRLFFQRMIYQKSPGGGFMDSGVGKQSTVFVKREHVLFISTICFALIKRQEEGTNFETSLTFPRLRMISNLGFLSGVSSMMLLGCSPSGNLAITTP